MRGGLLPAAPASRHKSSSKLPCSPVRLVVLGVCFLAAGYLASTVLLGPAGGGVAPRAGAHPAGRVPFSFSRPVAAPPADPAGARPRVLVTGGAGFIASHTVVELVGAGFAVTILDNLINSSPESVARVRKLVDAPEAIDFVKGDVRDEGALAAVLSAAPHAAVIHFAALKAVGESISKPLDYYENNLGGLTTVLAAAKAYGIKQVVFSSSATVYGNAAPPFTEATTVGAGITNPYGQTKYIAEIVLRDFTAANPAVAVACLRYFNPVGAHSSGTIGEDPQGIPNNIMPLCVRAPHSLPPRSHAFTHALTHTHTHTPARTREKRPLQRPARRRGQVPQAHHPRQRLRHARRHRAARLHPRGGPRQGARQGAAVAG